MMTSLYVLLWLIPITGFDQVTTTCNAPQASQFDFWIGEWELTWNDTIKGTNTITKEMNDCVIYEHFNDPRNNYKGSSWSVYNTQTNQWQQTWVDNSGGYIELIGGMIGGKMILTTPERKSTTGTILHHMIFYNIGDDSFDWNWEASVDHGVTWDLKWKIHYQRKP